LGHTTVFATAVSSVANLSTNALVHAACQLPLVDLPSDNLAFA
jgi:hypothetical protein